MIRILTICTGNVCRSPLAALLLQRQLSDLAVSVSSAGTRAREGMPMPREALALASSRGVEPALSRDHRAHYLADGDLLGVDLVLAMAREHRRHAVELNPSSLRSAFTLREFGRLTAELSDAEIARSMSGRVDVRERLGSALELLRSQRGRPEVVSAPGDDDVIDPYGRSNATYELSATQLEPGLSAVERVVRLSLS